MILVTSSALIESELQSEFGPIPPAFLPVGNRRLFEHQLQILPFGESVALTLPEGYELGLFDQHRLEEAGVKLLFLPQGLSLGEAILYAINLLVLPEDEGIKILHGDTLFEQLPQGDDLVALSEVADAYDWAVYHGKPDQFLGPMDPARDDVRAWVANGYFAFSHPRELIRALTETRFNFLNAVNLYHNRVGLKPAKISQWYDFGHVHTYYRSKSNMTTQRAFNQMSISSRAVTKRSEKADKMRAEANWYACLPSNIKAYAPQLLGVLDDDTNSGYQIEYLHLTALNELFAFGELPPFVWRRILGACLDFVDDCVREPAAANAQSSSLEALFGRKSARRLVEYGQQTGIDLYRPWRFKGQVLPGLTEILDRLSPHMPATGDVSSWYHGDLCFSNILYDFRTGRVKVIDPRGITPEGEISPYGDVRYDLAKLSHSVMGRYDLIIAGYFELDWQPYQVSLELPRSSRLDAIEQYFVRLMAQRYGLSEANLLAMQVHLFLSMLPLHADNLLRQQALMANALRLYSKLGTQR